MAIEKGRGFTEAALAEQSVDALQLGLMLDFCFAVKDLMDAKGITRKELAKRMHKSPSAITRMLNGDANITLRTLAEFMKALDLKVTICAGLTTEGGVTETLEVDNPIHEQDSSWNISVQMGFEQAVKECGNGR